MRLAVLVVAAVLLGVPAAGAWASEAFDRESFEDFVAMRTGDGEPVYWYTTGTVYSYPDGEPLFLMEGIDTARHVRDPDEDARVRQLSRKVFFYRDMTSGEVLREYRGREVTPIAYPYQLITYALEEGRIRTWVEQGSGRMLQRFGPIDNIQLRRIGETRVYTAPLFLDFPIGNDRRYQAFENYDFFIHPGGSGLEYPNQLSWVRYGDLPPFAGEGKSIIHLVSWRVDSYDALPAEMRDYLENDAPLWQAPPEDLAEIRELQAEESPPSGF